MDKNENSTADTTVEPEYNDPKNPINTRLMWIAKHPTIIQVFIWSIVVISLVVGVTLWLTGNLKTTDLGLGGIFLINLLGSATIFLPFPGIAAVCAASAPTIGLNLYGIVILSGIGSAIGECTAYLLGYGIINTARGKALQSRYKYYDRISKMMKKRGWFVILFFATIPNPVFDATGLAAGSLRYSIYSFFMWVLLGKIIKYIFTVIACYNGIEFIQRLIGG